MLLYVLCSQTCVHTYLCNELSLFTYSHNISSSSFDFLIKLKQLIVISLLKVQRINICSNGWRSLAARMFSHLVNNVNILLKFHLFQSKSMNAYKILISVLFYYKSIISMLKISFFTIISNYYWLFLYKVLILIFQRILNILLRIVVWLL